MFFRVVFNVVHDEWLKLWFSSVERVIIYKNVLSLEYNNTDPYKVLLSIYAIVEYRDRYLRLDSHVVQVHRYSNHAVSLTSTLCEYQYYMEPESRTSISYNCTEVEDIWNDNIGTRIAHIYMVPRWKTY